jgi:hypothetical protein
MIRASIEIRGGDGRGDERVIGRSPSADVRDARNFVLSVR